jgi:chitinase
MTAPRSRGSALAAWVLAGLFLLLCVSPAYAHYTPLQHRGYNAREFAPSARGVPSRSPGPAHRSPARAPPESLPELMSRRPFGVPSSSLHNASSVHPNLGKRGALRCEGGPCVDGSCCSKDKICGYGPNFCGAGCTSQCDSTAMCGIYSENGNVSCGMKLCCSAGGWCGVSGLHPPNKTSPG